MCQKTTVVGENVDIIKQFVSHVPENILEKHFRYAEVLKEEKNALIEDGYYVSHVDDRGIWYEKKINQKQHKNPQHNNDGPRLLKYVQRLCCYLPYFHILWEK